MMEIIKTGWPGLAAVALLMAILWLMQLKTKNAGVVDVAWAASIPLLSFIYLIMQKGNLHMAGIAVACMSAIWGFRLAFHIHKRGHGKPEDGRYADLRKSWASAVRLKFFIFFQFQAVAAFIFSLPFLLVISNPNPGIDLIQIVGMAIWLVAFAGEALSDYQLAQFKKDPQSKGQVCERGLWYYSRHPNYFFEWLIWVALAVVAWPAPSGSLAILCPVLMLFFLFKITGIPATEEQSLRTKGDAYRRYQQTTSVFVPWLKRKI